MQQSNNAGLLTTVFENEFFVAIDKPAGWLTIPGRHVDDTRPVIIHNLQKDFGTQKIYVVHRLDAEVSGLLLFAKTAEAHAAANRWFEQRLVAKSYEALTELGGAAPSVGERLIWQDLMQRGKKRTFIAGHGKVAITEAVFQGCKSIEGITAGYWKLEPKTGRTHQLRVHLANHGAPILGDSLYGAKQGWSQPGIALHSQALHFEHCLEKSALGLPDVIALKLRFN